MSYFKSIWGDYFFSILVLAVGLLSALFSSWLYQERWQEQTERTFSSVANDRIELIRSEVQHNDVVLRSLASFYDASKDVTHHEFQIFSKTLLKDSPFIEGTTWIPVVTDAERDAFEQIAKEWDEEFTIREKDKNGKLVTSPRRPVYMPLYFSQPQRSNNFLGFDYLTDKDRSETLKLASITRTTAATAKVRLLRDQQVAVIFAYPVFHLDQDGSPLKGYVLTAVPLAKLIDSALTPLVKQGVNIVINDKSVHAGNEELLYTRSTRLKDIPEEEIVEDFNAGNRMNEKALLNVGGRVWEVTIQSARGYFEIKVQPLTYGILAGGIIFTLLLFTFMFSRIRENQRIGERVLDRTRELQLAKGKIETILFSTNDGILGLDKSAVITFYNPGNGFDTAKHGNKPEIKC